jgi:hypothetical protein
MQNFKLHPKLNVLVSKEGIIIGRKGKPLKPAFQNGYRVISLNQKTMRVHRIVVETYIGEIPRGYCVNHIDGDKINNSLSNLEIITYKQNTEHAYKTGLAVGKKGSENSGSKLQLHQVLEMYKMFEEGKTNDEISEVFNLHSRYISLMRHGKRWQHIYNEYFNENNKVIKSCGNLKYPLDFSLKILKDTLDKTQTNTQIALKYGVDQSTICRIRLRKTWDEIWKYYETNVTTIEKQETELSRVQNKLMVLETESNLNKVDDIV